MWRVTAAVIRIVFFFNAFELELIIATCNITYPYQCILKLFLLILVFEQSVLSLACAAGADAEQSANHRDTRVIVYWKWK